MERLLAQVDGDPEKLVYLKATSDGKLIVDGASSSSGGTASTWEDAGYTLDSAGKLISETQVNTSTGATRTRAWTYTTSGSNTVATPGAWA